MTAGRLLGVLLLALAGLAIWSAQSLEVAFAADPLGPRAFPTTVALLMALCGALLLIPRGPDFDWPERLAAPPLLVLVLVSYALLLVPLGFLLATILLASSAALLFGARPFAALATGLITSACLWALFDRVLDLPLPKGLLGA